MPVLTAELHVHTVLSPCADVEMIPPLIVAETLERGIQLIAITDHNTSANVQAVQRAARSTGLIVLPGMEVQTQEDVHMLCLFDELEQLTAWQKIVDQRLPPLQNNVEYFGEQFIVDETGDFLAREERLLITAVDLSLGEAFAQVEALGGLAIPAHVDRKAYGLFAILGFVPPEMPAPALEISRHLKPAEACQKFPQLEGYPLIQSGDVHRLSEFLGANEVCVEAVSIRELRLALAGEGGRAWRIRNSE